MTIANFQYHYQKLQKEFFVVRHIFLEAHTRAYGSEQNNLSAQAYAVMRTHDSWARYCRTLFLLSMIGGTVSLSGTAIIGLPGINRTDDALSHIRKNRAQLLGKSVPKEWEPAWHSPAELIPLVTRFNLSNALAISGGLGATPSPINDLTKIRNFFAHRSERAAIAIHPITIGAHPLTFVSDLVSSGITRLEDWTNVLLLQARAAAA